MSKEVRKAVRAKRQPAQGRYAHTLGPARHHEEARGFPRAGPAEDVRVMGVMVRALLSLTSDRAADLACSTST